MLELRDVDDDDGRDGERLVDLSGRTSLEEEEGGNDGLGDVDDEVTSGQAWCLYLSHFLSMWNSRMYEFGAVSPSVQLTIVCYLLTDVPKQILFIQSAFPGNLTFSSIKYAFSPYSLTPFTMLPNTKPPPLPVV